MSSHAYLEKHWSSLISHSPIQGFMPRMCCTATSIAVRPAPLSCKLWNKSLKKCDATHWNDWFVLEKRDLRELLLKFLSNSRKCPQRKKKKAKGAKSRRKKDIFKPERKFQHFLEKGEIQDSKTKKEEGPSCGGRQRVNIPNMPILHGRLPGDRGGFRWWWCVRT